MADNTTINPGSGGDVVATDEIAGVKYQRVKVDFGADGSATDVADAEGARLPVKAVKARGATSAISRVADVASSTTLIAANTARIRVTITNDSSAVLYVLEDSGVASSVNYTYVLGQYGNIGIDDYTGQINGIWATDPGDGGAQVTEITP